MLLILNVGHGNCALVIEGTKACVIDAGGKSSQIYTELAAAGVTEIEALYISHADADHCAGALPLLLDKHLVIRQVFFNPDTRETDIVVKIRTAIGKRAKAGGTTPHFLFDSEAGLKLGPYHIRCVYPPYEKVHAAATTTSANRLSAVLIVEKAGSKKGLAAFAADVEDSSVADLSANKAVLGAEVLVYPHHGGRGVGEKLNELLLNEVAPEVVVFSIGTHPPNPQPDVIKQVRKVLPKVHIACTGMSVHCKATTAHSECAGRMQLVANGTNGVFATQTDHKKKVSGYSKAICR